MNIYKRLKVEKIKPTIQNCSEEQIIETLENTYKNTAFSTFPYIQYNFNSLESITKLNCGNCISLSLYAKRYLKKNFDIESFLIPCSIPKKYSHPRYLDLSHVSLAIPINYHEFYIIDLAFYFLEPMYLNKLYANKDIYNVIHSKNIYDYEPNSILKEYVTVDRIKYTTMKLNEDLIYNEYQTIPAETYYINCYSIKDNTDKWNYYLINILNPDEAISTFFISIKNNPFIADTYMDNNGICSNKFMFS